jgi:hypothetical protein
MEVEKVVQVVVSQKKKEVVCSKYNMVEVVLPTSSLSATEQCKVAYGFPASLSLTATTKKLVGINRIHSHRRKTQIGVTSIKFGSSLVLLEEPCCSAEFCHCLAELMCA